MNKIRFILSILILCAGSAGAQLTIRGVVRDAKTDEPLPMANIWIEGTYRGTITNVQGEYTLLIKSLPATVQYRYIGYESVTKTITSQFSGNVDVALNPKVIELEALVVTGEDPAMNIMRKVIAKKREWRPLLQRFQADAYSRTVLENDSGIVSISESLSEIFWDSEEGWREVIKGKTSTENISPSMNFAFASDFSNLYDDDIEFMGYRFVGPTHPDALKHYSFKLTGHRQLDDQTVYDIDVIAKSKLQPLFTGRIAVLNEVYAMIEVDLVPSESIVFPQPFQEVNVHFKQQYNNFGHQFWLPVDNHLQGDIKIGFVGLSIPMIKFTQSAHISDYQINESLPDSLYSQKRRIQVDSLALREDVSFKTARLIPLTTDEDGAYQCIDSTMTLNKAYQPTGFLAKYANISIGSEEANMNMSSENNRSRGLLSGLSPRLRYNRVDGAHLGLQLNRPLTNNLRMTIQGNYKTGLKRWGYGANLSLLWANRRGQLYLGYESGTQQRLNSIHDVWIFNSARTLLTGRDYFDYFWSKAWTASLGYYVRPIRTQLRGGVSIAQHESLDAKTDYNLFGRDVPLRVNPHIEKGKLRTLWAQVTIGEGGAPWGVVGGNRVQFSVEHSSPDIFSSEFSYTRYRVTADAHIPTFLRRRLLPMALDIQLSAGWSNGLLPIQRFGGLDSRMGGFTPYGSFRSLYGQPLEGESHVGIFMEHDFRSVPFEILGLRSLAKAGLGFIVHGAFGRTWIDEDRLASMTYPVRYQDDWFKEVGVSINGILGLVRLDFTRRLDKKDFFVGVGMARMF